MTPRLLLDTHILIRWTFRPKKLSKEQLRVLRSADRRKEPLAISSVTFLEIAMLADVGKADLEVPIERYFSDITLDDQIVILPLTPEIAIEAARLRILRDPMDRAIAATARIHNLTLVTSDQRICDSGLIPVLA